MVVGCGMRDLNDLQWWGVAPSAVAAAQRITQKSKDMSARAQGASEQPWDEIGESCVGGGPGCRQYDMSAPSDW